MAGAITVNYLGMRLVQIVVMLAGTFFVVGGGLTIGGFVGFLLLLGVFYRPLDKIAAVIESYPKGVAGFRRFRELLATEPDVVEAPGAVAAGPFAGAIRFERVGFGYAAERPVIRNFDLTIRRGETVAFVGPSGAGKTTLCSLLPRFYDVEAGRITIDGIDVRALTLASLRRQIGIVQQDVFLFGGTIRENIAYGRLEASEAEIVAAARRARLDTMIAALPDGLDTLVGERRRQAFGRTEAAPRHRPHLPQGPTDPHPGRGDVGARYGDRARNPALLRRARAGPHHAGHRPPPRNGCATPTASS